MQITRFCTGFSEKIAACRARSPVFGVSEPKPRRSKRDKMEGFPEAMPPTELHAPHCTLFATPPAPLCIVLNAQVSRQLFAAQ